MRAIFYFYLTETTKINDNLPTFGGVGTHKNRKIGTVLAANGTPDFGPVAFMQNVKSV
jgi:hypothetical protein